MLIWGGIQIKVETDLFYQACDEIGLLVIQDMPALRPSQSKIEANCQSVTILPDADQQAEFGRQLDLLVNQLKSYPSIATWVS
jgi:beta-galactosidase/beta-glucuronidase